METNLTSRISALLGLGSEDRKRAVWNKGKIIPGYDPDIWRHDDYNTVIKWSEHGNRDSKYGWEIDHFPTPLCFGGSDEHNNLRPLHHCHNSSHGGMLGALLSK